jgi:hypothetical protein
MSYLLSVPSGSGMFVMNLAIGDVHCYQCEKHERVTRSWVNLAMWNVKCHEWGRLLYCPEAFA